MSRPKCSPCLQCARCYSRNADASEALARIQKRQDEVIRIDANIRRASDPVQEARERMLARYGRSDDEREAEGQSRKPAPSTSPKGQGQRPNAEEARQRMIQRYGKRPEEK